MILRWAIYIHLTTPEGRGVLKTMSSNIDVWQGPISSAMRQKGKSQNRRYKKTKHAKFSEKWTFLNPWYAHARTPILRFALFLLLPSIYATFGSSAFSTTWNGFKHGVFSGPYFPVSSPNTGKYRPEKTSYLDPFHAVLISHFFLGIHLFRNRSKYCIYRIFHFSRASKLIFFLH